ncbi:MAG: hypothetical protein QW165_03460 [Candidatus Woesearchaeota archaeon]
MVSSTETTEKIPRIYVVDAEQIYKFCKATGDENKVHQGDNPVVPGFFLDFLVKTHFDMQARARNPLLRLTGLEAKFRLAIHKNEPFFVKDEEIYNPAEGTLMYKMAIVKSNVLQTDGTTANIEAVEGSIKYSIAPNSPLTARLNSKILPYSKQGKSYYLNEETIECVKQSLGNAQHDKIATIVSATSHALQTDKESYDVLFNETLLGNKYPFFAKHDLTVYEGIEKLPTGAKFIIHNKHGEARMGLHPAYVRGVNSSGVPLFDLTCTIIFHEQKS